MDGDYVNKLVYNTKDLSKVLNIGRTKVYALIKSEEIRSVRIGHKILVPKKEVTRWLNKSLNGK